MRNVGFGPNQPRPLFAALLVLLLCGPADALAQARAGFPMPSVIGLTEDEAERRVTSAGKAYGARSAEAVVVGRRPDSRPADRIIQQLEPPGTPMRPYMDDVGGIYGQVTFRVILSSGPPRPTTFPMPEVVGLTVPDAERRVVSAGREVRATGARAVIVGRRSDNAPAGRIIRQLEPPGTRMAPSADEFRGTYGEVEFRVELSTGPDPAPNFVGSRLREAARLARRTAVVLEVGPGQRDPRVPEGIILRQDPPAGEPMPGRRVTVWPSAGYPLPNFVRQPVERARDASRELEFRLQEQSEERVDVPRGFIFDQDPPAETLLPLDGPVSVVVSAGWPTPDFRKLDEDAAAALAGEKRVTLRVAERRRVREPQPGIVIDQNPPPGALLPPGQAVNVVVSASDPTPRLIGRTKQEARAVAARRAIELAETESPSRATGPGRVAEQSPEPDAPLPADGRVAVVISTGWPTPDFVGRTGEEASGIAADLDITLVEAGSREHFELSAGRVIEQEPVADALLPPDRRVRIILSLGWPVAPDAMGQSAQSVRQEFLARHPNAVVDQRDSLLTLEPAGTVISQNPEPHAKLGPKQRLQLVASAVKPPWVWPAAGVVSILLAVGVIAGLKAALGSSAQQSIRTEDPGGVRLRVTKDHGVQTMETKDEGDADRTDSGDIVRIRVQVDLGEQSAGPIEDTGEEP